MPELLSVPVFWREFKAGGPRLIVLDMPFVSAPESVNGVEITGWATYDTILEKPRSYPPRLQDWVRRNFGGQIRFRESSGPMTSRGFLRVRDQLKGITGQVGALAGALVEREAWDLLMVTFSSLHTAGHKLWDTSNVIGPISAGQRREMLDALRQVYIACDWTIGRLLSRAGADVNVLVMAVHGMQENSTCNEILPEMLQRVLANEPLERLPLRKAGLLTALRNSIPSGWRHAIKSRLPMHLQDKLTFFWRAGRGRWQDKQAIALPSDGQGMIRINLAGREAKGVVLPGREYDELCARIMAGLQTFVDADGHGPLIAKVARLDPALDYQPDLVVDWADTPASSHRAIHSPKYGTIPWPTPGRNPEGRSGNHRMEGFLLAAGKDIKSGTIKGARLIDLAPTILTLLGQPVPPEMEGRALFRPRHS